MNECMCYKTYTCLYCEDIANGLRKPTGERIRRVVVSDLRKVAECGTRAGYNRHLKLKTPTCQACREAQCRSVKAWKKIKESK